jgi:8-oxo-dGTP pyrophosphatase MutT (NUDIX family)
VIKKLKENPIYWDQWLTVIKDDVEFSSGNRGTYVKLSRKPRVGVVLHNPKQQIVLLKILRYPTQIESWEIPGGGIEKLQNPVDAAIEEIKQEVGITLDKTKLQTLGSFYPLNCLSDERITLFMAPITVQILPKHTPDDDEIISAHLVDIAHAFQMIKEGKINDATTALAIFLANNQLPLLAQ